MAEPRRIDLAQRDTIRLVSTGRLKVPVLLPLAANHGALEDLASLEGATNARLHAQETGLPALDPRELVFGRAGSTFVNAAFTHTRPGGNRFNDEGRGAWYCAFTAQTAVSEVAYHLTHELEAIGRFDNITDYAELIADFIGLFHDLRAADAADETALHTDPAEATPPVKRSRAGFAPSPTPSASSIRRLATVGEPASSRSAWTLCKTCDRAGFGGLNGKDRQARRWRGCDASS